jgi:hypothetical protein
LRIPTSIERNGSAGRVGSSNVAVRPEAREAQHELLDRKVARVDGQACPDVPAELDPDRPSNRNAERDPYAQRSTCTFAALDRAHPRPPEPDSCGKPSDRHATPTPGHADLATERGRQALRFPRPGDLILCPLVASHPAHSVKADACLAIAS